MRHRRVGSGSTTLVLGTGLIALHLGVLSPTSGVTGPAAPPPRSAAQVAGTGLTGEVKQVDADGVVVTVPRSWPVFDFSHGGTGCVRLDRHAVYVGEPAHTDCPAHLVGSVGAVQIVSESPVVAANSRRNAHGLRYDGENSVNGAITFPAAADHAGVVVTVGSDPSLAHLIAASVRKSTSTRFSSAPSSAGLAPVAWSRSLSSTATSSSTTSTVTGGFDACTAPSTATMKAWLASPYRAVNIYMGGADRACAQANLNASWVHTVVGQGWTLIPTYVGLQAPCGPFSGTINPSYAAAEGASSADDAVDGMTGLALGSGNPVYFDMESYDTSNAGCVQAVETFLNAWTVELHNRGYLSGVYSSASSGITNLVEEIGNSSFHEPDAIWFAHWNGSDTVSPDPYIPDGDWSDHQRIHQYQGGHNETWGGVTINIDNDAVDGPTAPEGSGSFPTVDLFQPLPTARIYGTNAPPLVAGSDRVITVLGTGGIPSTNVDAVVVNVEVFGPTSAGYIRVTPTGSPSGTAVQEFAPHQAISNLVTVKLGPGGTISLHLSAGAAYVFLDVSGYYSPPVAGPGDLFQPLPTARIFGTDTPPLVSSSDRQINVLGVGGVPTTNVDAVVVNVEVFGPTSAGYIRVTPTGSPSGTAVQEFAAREMISNLVSVKVGTGGTITVHLSAGAAYVFIDVSGYYSTPAVSTGDMFHPLPAARIYGTDSPPLVRGSDQAINVLGVGGIPATNVDAVVINVEIYNPTTAGYLRVTPTSGTSGTAVQEFAVGQTISNLVMVKVGPGGTVTLHLSAGSAQIFVDAAGYFA